MGLVETTDVLNISSLKMRNNLTKLFSTWKWLVTRCSGLETTV